MKEKYENNGMYEGKESTEGRTQEGEGITRTRKKKRNGMEADPSYSTPPEATAAALVREKVEMGRRTEEKSWEG